MTMLEKSDYEEPVCPFVLPESGKPYREFTQAVPLEEVINECNRLFSAGNLTGLGDHLRHWRHQAAELGDQRSELSILNELIGHYRMQNDRDRGLAAVRDAFKLIGEAGITGSVSAGTILLNGATALCAFGEVKEALLHYAEAFRCYGRHLAPEDLRFAGLFNNMSSAYAANGEFRYAEVYCRKAIELLARAGNLTDQAVGWVNLAQIFARQDREDGRIGDALDQAYGCLDSLEIEYNAYYAHTCSKCAGAFSDLGQPERAAELKARAEALYAGD